MLKIGLTGGIGSGKTTVAKLFQILGVPVYHADQRAKQLQVENEEVKEQVQAVFGEEIYTSEGKLRKEELAQVVFSDESALKQLNEIVHPVVGKDFEQWIESHQERPYILKEAALLFEAGSADQLDYVIVVTAPKKMRIQRIRKRDGVRKKDVEARMDHQWPQKKKVRQADFEIKNNEKQLLIPQVLSLHKQFLQEINST